MTDVFINNKLAGEVDDPESFREEFIEKRRDGDVNTFVNIHYDDETDKVEINTGKGRTCRPLIVVEDGEPLLTEEHVEEIEDGEKSWQDLVDEGVIEYIDAAEEENCLVALTEDGVAEQHTHMEISPLDMLGIAASIVPYGNHNQGVRLTQGAKNQKQAIGFYAANFHARMDNDVNLLHYPQFPIVKTITHDILDFKEHPSGQNCVVAIMAYKGYNMEDAIIVNKGSVDRGFARNTYYRPMETEELRYSGGLTDEIGIPEKDVKGYRSEHDYRLLDEDGIIRAEATIQEGDVVVGKTSPPRFLSSMEEYNLAASSRRESSIALQHGEQGTVDFVMLTESDEGNKLVQVRVREERIPEMGDKFTSRHGQKGVISILLPEADVPFTSSGIKPDIIFSPHGIPSRMTVSHLLECVGGKVGSLAGRYVDGTTFEGEDEDALRAELLSLGFREDGTETMYSGTTGEQYDATIFIGNMYYLKLKHMVANKIHARARGPIQLLTRQPTEGRSKEGGLRLGEMEKDTFVAHGASITLKERFQSDQVRVPVCEKSGLVGYYDARKNNKAMSPIHGDSSEMSDIQMSYAFMLFLNELKSLGIYPKMKLEGKY